MAAAAAAAPAVFTKSRRVKSASSDMLELQGKRIFTRLYHGHSEGFMRILAMGARRPSRRKMPGAAPSSGIRATLLLRDAEIVDLHFEQVIHTDTVNAVGLRVTFRHRVDYLAVDYIIDLVGAYPYFQVIGRFAGGVGLLHGVAGCFWRYILCRIAVAALDQPRAVLGHLEIQILLLRSFEIGSAENQPIVVRMSAGLHQSERAFQCVIAGRSIGRVPVHRCLRVRGMESGSRRNELYGTSGVRVGGGRTSVHADLPTFR